MLCPRLSTFILHACICIRNSPQHELISQYVIVLSVSQQRMHSQHLTSAYHERFMYVYRTYFRDNPPGYTVTNFFVIIGISNAPSFISKCSRKSHPWETTTTGIRIQLGFGVNLGKTNSNQIAPGLQVDTLSDVGRMSLGRCIALW